MSERSDHELLAEFARTASEPAFAALVARHVNLVYSTALRFCGNPHAAQEITQAVFIILARKAGKLSSLVVLSGWLYQTTRLTAANFVRSEIHRQEREQEAYMQSTLNEDDFAAWKQIAPLLDEAMGHLGETDRNAVVLRYFENKTAQEVGTALRLTEAAAHKRVNRALDKLRKIFSKRGVTLSVATMAGVVSANSIHAAPAGLAAVATAAATGAGVSTSTLTLIKGALKIMAWTKVKTAVIAGVVVLLAAGTTTIALKEIQEHKTYPWQVPQAGYEILYDMPPMVKIVPTKFSKDGSWCCDSSRGAMGIAQPVGEIIRAAYLKDKLRTVFETALPEGKYDFIAKLVPARVPHKSMLQNEGWTLALQKQVTTQFGLTGRLENRDADVLVLKPAAGGIKGFKVSHSKPHGQALVTSTGKMQCYEQPVSTLTGVLEGEFQIPIVDRTGLVEDYDFLVTWDEPDPKTPNPTGLKQALHDQLGLDLVPNRELIEMLVVKK